jgi:hypothetical protein
MSLSLTTSFVEKKNSVLPLAQSPTKNGLAIRVASTGPDTLGVLIESGKTGTSEKFNGTGPISFCILMIEAIQPWISTGPFAAGNALTGRQIR